MPTDLAFKTAGRQAIFRFLDKERGEGWWGSETMAGYYAEQGANFFNWVQVHPLMPATMSGQYPFDHAGIGETSLMLALCPEAVDAGHFADNTGWYTATAADASSELGQKGVAMILDHLRAIFLA
jgi:creatinine amidohydrolase/Fe(II)-dependent formamide hydrolase-like protein